MTYAESTSVPVEKSRAELETLLMKAGASQRLLGSDDDRGIAWALFTITPKGGELRQVRLQVPLPTLASIVVPKGSRRTQVQLYEQACRARWRAFVLLVKAKLEAIAMGVSTIEREFLADIALPEGGTVADLLIDHLRQAYTTGKMPPLLPSGVKER